MVVVGLPEDKAIFDNLVTINQNYQLGLDLYWKEIAKTNIKTLTNVAVEFRVFVGIIKGLPTLLYYTGDEHYQNYELLKVSLNWQTLTKRIVTAGKKTELLLKASKLHAGMTVIDATAGFGHDSLILASTGARVTMIEQNPLLFLLLTFEKQTMQQQPNWQKLMARLDIRFGQAVDVLPTLPKANVVYLDPMFPANSYKSAVSKTMQLLHELVAPPTLEEELALFTTARQQLNTNGSVIVKRPKNAPFLGNIEPSDSVSNNVVRFDRYLN